MITPSYPITSDVSLPHITKGCSQLRSYIPTLHPTPPFNYSRFTSNQATISSLKPLSLLCTDHNDLPTFLCGDLIFIENPAVCSPAPHLLKLSFTLGHPSCHTSTDTTPPRTTTPFFHITEDPTSPYSWSSRIDHFVLPL